MPELMLSIGIVAVLFSISTISLLGTQRSSSLGSQVDTILTDIRDIQSSAFAQKTGGMGTESDFGVYLDQDSYTLFRGSVYDQMNTSNFVINLNAGIILTNITTPNSTVIFSAGSGDIDGYVLGQDSFDIADTATGISKTITLNRYGVPLE